MVVSMQQGRMSRRVSEFAGGEAGLGGGVGEVVEGVGVDLGDAGAQKGADEELEALEFGLEDDEPEVGLGVRVARLLFHELNLFCRQQSGHQGMRSTPGEREREGGPTYLPTDSLQNTFHQGVRPWQYLRRTPLCDPCSCDFL